MADIPATAAGQCGICGGDHDAYSALCPSDSTPATAARRRYSDAAETAFRAVGMNPMYGPAQFAGGPYWPDELDRRADRLEALIPHLRLAAAALRREIAADQLTAGGVANA